MTNDKRKRAYARPQPQLPPATSEAFEQAWAKFEAEDQAFETMPFGPDGSLPPDAAARRDEAVDALFSVPASSGEALARKIELFAFPMHIDGRLSEPSVRAWVAKEGSEEQRKLLVMYLDALALSGVRAGVEAPTGAVMPGITPAHAYPTGAPVRGSGARAQWLEARIAALYAQAEHDDTDGDGGAAVAAAEAEIAALPCDNPVTALVKLRQVFRGFEEGDRLDDPTTLKSVIDYLSGMVSDTPATGAEVAALDWTAWADDDALLMTAERWVNAWNPHGISLRFAYEIMRKSKAELIDHARALGGTQDDGGTFYTLAQQLQDTEQVLTGWATMVGAAETRMMVAAHALVAASGGDLGDSEAAAAPAPIGAVRFVTETPDPEGVDTMPARDRTDEARQHIAAYRATGGDLKAYEKDGKRGLFTHYPAEPSADADALEARLVADPGLCVAVLNVLMAEGGQ